ncbi:MAG: hypothetical protein CMO01_23200 [Thalassobius sp.]|nr:hypothetical protein [Thalassovita sp.]
MNTKLLMGVSAGFLGLLGIALSFIPQEILTFFKLQVTQLSTLFLQIIGALYMGFAMLNWMSKASLIGGIYNRPVAIANVMHFTVVALALVKIVFNIQQFETTIISFTAIYIVLAAAFGYVLLTSPVKESK